MKTNTSKIADPNSKRSIKRRNRNFEGSRPNRRAKQRLESANAGYLLGGIADKKNGLKAFTKPGAQKHW